MSNENNVIQLESHFTSVEITPVVLPKGKTEDDIYEITRTWDDLYITFKDGSSLEFSIDSKEPEVSNESDKRPEVTWVTHFNEEIHNPKNYEKFGVIELDEYELYEGEPPEEKEYWVKDTRKTRDVWVHPNDENNIVYIDDKSFYETSGTPVCEESGVDYEYSHTEVML